MAETPRGTDGNIVGIAGRGKAPNPMPKVGITEAVLKASGTLDTIKM